jgi:hypothetical protein
VKILWVMCLALTLCGCDLFGPARKIWTEDILLDDGSTIVVKRSVTFNESAAWGGGSYNAVETAATLTFTGELAKLPSWNVPLRPMVLYRDKTAGDQWVIVAYSTSCEVWSARGEPVPPYWEYRLTEAGWKEVPLSKSSMGRTGNVFTGYSGLKTKHVSVRDQQEYLKTPGLGKKYMSVNKDIVPRSGEFGCAQALR